MKYATLTSTGLIALAQASNFLVPLLLFPLYNRYYGVSVLGQFSFCLSFAQVIQVFADYGFNLTATRRVALGLENGESLHRFVSSVQWIRILIPLAGLVFFVAVIFFRFDESKNALLPIYLVTFGTALSPSWFFIGKQAYRANALLTVIPRLVLIAASYWLVPEGLRLQQATLIFGVGYLVTGIAGMLLIRFGFGVRLVWPSAAELGVRLREGLGAFATSITSTVYSVGCTVVLGFVSTSSEVALYSTAEKLVKAAQFVVAPYAQYIYPKATRLMSAAVPDWKSLNQLARNYALIGAVVSIGIFFLGPIMLKMFYGDLFQFNGAIPRLMALLPAIYALSLFVSQTVLIAGGHEAKALTAYVAGAVIFLVLAPLLMPPLGALGAVIDVVLTEAVVLAILYWRLHFLKARSGLNRAIGPETLR